MNASKQALGLFFTLVALACSGWYFASSQPSLIRLDEKALSREADGIILDLTVSRYDESGKLASYLQTSRLEHIPQNETHFLQSPRIVIEEPNQPAWEITASQARAFHKGEKIIFTHHVVIHQAKSETTQESTITTEKLVYFPKKKLATTEQAVRFEQPGSVVYSQGMKAYLADKRVELSKARATYEPKRA